MNSATIMLARNLDEAKLKKFIQTTEIDGIITTFGTLGCGEKQDAKRTESALYTFIVRAILHTSNMKMDEGSISEVEYQNHKKFERLVAAIKETAKIYAEN